MCFTNSKINYKLLAYLKSLDEEQYKEKGFIKPILRFLQLLCEGHNLDLQARIFDKSFVAPFS